MNNSPNQNNNPPKKNKVFAILPYILIPLMMVIGIAIASQQSTNRSSEAKYYQIVQYFDKGEVSEFKLNISNGSLEYKLKGEKTFKKYTVPSVNVFLEDVNETVREHNKNAKSDDQPFINNYELRKNAHTNLEVSRTGGCFLCIKYWKHIEYKLNLPQQRSCCSSCLSI